MENQFHLSLKKLSLNFNDFTPYIPPKTEEFKKVEVHYFSYYKNGILKKVITMLLLILVLNLIQREHQELIPSILASMIK